MFGIDGLRDKLLAVLLAFAILPMGFIGILSLGEMNRASSDIENNITNLSTSLNRSALAAGSHEADQVQLAEAKARQLDAFFLRIASENELVARYAASSSGTKNLSLIHISEPTRLLSTSYAVFCFTKKKKNNNNTLH